MEEFFAPVTEAINAILHPAVEVDDGASADASALNA